MLGYEEFKEGIRICMEQEMGDGYRVDINSIRKENVGIQDAVAVFDKESAGNSVSPNIYLGPLYQGYKEGMGLQEIVEAVVAMYYRELAGAKTIVESMPDIRNYESCKNMLYFRLAGTEKNRSLLGKVPHYEVMDLSVIPYLLVKETDGGIGSMMVKEAMVKSWGVSTEDILKQALANTPKLLPVMVDTMRSVMERVLKESDGGAGGWQDTAGNTEEPQAFPSVSLGAGRISEIFIMTNRKGLNGFATILYPGALKNAADMIGADLYVVPSSVHEAVLIPAGCFMTASELSGMVREVNTTCVAEEEIVSDSVYFYDRKERKLCMAGEEELCVRL